ncbi:uncharacterized protein LOC132721195 [Ruditapes philippinarum]|uniref:uncharacterized protein LOC132721195 n=1 Tax=Ruditapes philippinarum TaxID=129788 RepID=UPI00295C28E2|nr:uncharacterized protein LOC132721195 [Ruditapes philippinarum]
MEIFRIQSGFYSPEQSHRNTYAPRSDCYNRNADSGYSSRVGTSHGDYYSELGSSNTFESSYKQNKITIEALCVHYKFLKSEIDPKEVEDYLYELEVIDDEILEKCNAATNRRRRVDILVKHVFKIAKWNNDKILKQFEKSLIRTNQGYVVDKITEPFSELNVKDTIPNAQLKGFIHEMESCIFENVDPRNFIDDLITEGAITFDEHEDISQHPFRRDRISFYMNKVKLAVRSTNNEICLRKLILPMINFYPKIFEEYENGSHRNPTNVPLVKLDSLVQVRCHLKGKRGNCDFRQIERNCVHNFYSDQSKYKNWLENMIEECICSFEKLTIASVVIQLRTKGSDSLSRIIKACEDGKAKQWIISLLDKEDLKQMKKMQGTKMQIKIHVYERRNEQCAQQEHDCLCTLNRNSILCNYNLIQENIQDIDDVLENMCQLKLPGYEQFESFMRRSVPKKRIDYLLDYLLQRDTPKIYFCILQKYIQRSMSPDVIKTILKDDQSRMMQLDKEDIWKHEDYLLDELDIRFFHLSCFQKEANTSNKLKTELFESKVREERVGLFLRYLREENDITWFLNKLKESQKYIWDVIVSGKHSIESSERDLQAVNIMNDHIVEEIDPLHLKQRISIVTARKLRFDDFEEVTSRRERAQFFINRLSVDTMDEVLIAMRRSGYERIVDEIKAGSLSKEYRCPRLSHQTYEEKCVFHSQMEIHFDLTDFKFVGQDVKSFDLDGAHPVSVDIYEDKTEPSLKNFERRDDKPFKTFKRQICNESSRETESGFLSISEEATSINGVPEIQEFEDEGIHSWHSGSSSVNDSVKCKTYEHDAVDYEKKICVQSRSIKYPSRPSFSNGSVFQRRRFNQPCIVPKIHIGALFRPERPRVPLALSSQTSVRIRKVNYSSSSPYLLSKRDGTKNTNSGLKLERQWPMQSLRRTSVLNRLVLARQTAKETKRNFNINSFVLSRHFDKLCSIPSTNPEV